MEQNEVRITVIDGAEAGEVLSASLNGRKVVVGRSRQSDICLRKDGELSGTHFEISRSETGVELLNLGSNPTSVNGQDMPKGAKRILAVGDDVRVGDRLRFRFDAIGAANPEPAADAPSMTRATRVADAASQTHPTVAADAVSMTRSTVVADAASMTRPAQGRIPERIFVPSRHSVDVTAAAAIPEEGDTANAPTRAMEDMPSIDPNTGLSADSGIPTGSGVPTTGFGAGAADGETVALDDPTTGSGADRTKTLPMGGDRPSGGTVIFDPVVWKREQEIQRQKRLYRRILMVACIVLFLVGLGFVVWTRWPRAERYLTVPLVPGTERRDYAHCVLKDANGQEALVAYYVNDRRMREHKTADGGIEVNTFLGRDRDVSFWMRVARYGDASELQLSLEESVARIRKRKEAKEGMAYISTPEWYGEGYCFLESEYPGASHGMYRGTRMFRSEYLIERKGEKRQGVLFVLRDRATVWIVERDVPALEWGRAQFQLRINPNVEFFDGYLRNRWESPGMAELLPERDLKELFREVEYELELPVSRKGEWKGLKRKLNTLVYKTLGVRSDDQKRALGLLSKFQTLQEREYNGFELEYHLQSLRQNKGKDGKVRASESCRKVFGLDDKEYFSVLIGDLEAWKCQKR